MLGAAQIAPSAANDEAAAPVAADWMDHETQRAHRVACAGLRQDDLRWLARGFSAYLAGKGSVPLERCLRLPTNDAARQRAARDHWLRLAWSRSPSELSPWRRSESLAVAITRFRTTKWPRWKSMTAAPVDADSLDAALFEAFRSHDRIPSTPMQLHNIAQSDGH